MGRRGWGTYLDRVGAARDLIEGSVARQGRKMMGAKAEKKNLEPMTMQLFVYEASQG